MPVEAGSERISSSGSLVQEITGPVRNQLGKLPVRFGTGAGNSHSG